MHPANQPIHAIFPPLTCSFADCLRDQCRYIDGRVWPKEDELEVRLMISLIDHVTGTCLSSYSYQANTSLMLASHFISVMHACSFDAAEVLQHEVLMSAS